MSVAATPAASSSSPAIAIPLALAMREEPQLVSLRQPTAPSAVPSLMVVDPVRSTTRSVLIGAADSAGSEGSADDMDVRQARVVGMAEVGSGMMATLQVRRTALSARRRSESCPRSVPD